MHTALKFKKLVSCIYVELLYRSGHYLEAYVTSVTLYLENKNKYWIYYSCWMYWPRCCLFPTVCFPKLNDKNNKELNWVLSTKTLGLTERLWHGQWKNPDLYFVLIHWLTTYTRTSKYGRNMCLIGERVYHLTMGKNHRVAVVSYLLTTDLK